MMSKIEIFKKALYEFIGHNKRLIEDLKVANKNKLLEIHLTGFEGSNAHYDSFFDYHSVNIGIKEISRIYDKCADVSAKFDNKMLLSLNDGYSDYENPKSILDVVHVCENNVVAPTSAEILESCFCLQDGQITKKDAITLLCYMFTLYHELGHVVNDSSNKRQLDKEYAADDYAYECIKSFCKGKNEDQRRAIILSTIISISSILNKRNEKEENEDSEHPHSIERIYLFLQSLGVEEDSSTWEFSYNIIQTWCEHNNIDTSFIYGEKCSYKARMIQFYDHFKKK